VVRIEFSAEAKRSCGDGMKPSVQPKWLQDYFGGVEEGWRYSVVFESERWAVVTKAGHTFWGGRGEKRPYVSRVYELVLKTATWRDCDGRRGTLHEGRASKGDLVRMQAALSAAEGRP